MPPHVAYVTMRFPKVSEAFAAVDIRNLRDLGAAVSVFNLRGRDDGHEPLLREHGLNGLAISSPGWRTWFVPVLALFRPMLFARLMLFIARHGWKNPRHFIASMAFAPRAFEIAVEIGRIRPDVVHLFWGHWPSLVGRLIARTSPGSVLTMFLGAYDLHTGYSGSAEVGCAAKSVFTHTNCNAPAIERLGIPVSQIRVVHRGIELQTMAAWTETKIPGRVAAVGRLIAGKAMADVLFSFAIAVRSLPRASLVIIGDGPERSRLEALSRELGIGDAVTFLGHVPHARVFSELKLAEAFVLLSKSERLPNAIKEAIAHGCACVATATPGIDELMPMGCGGLVVPISDRESAGAALVKLLADSALRLDLVENGQRLLRAQFDAAASMRQYLAVWSNNIPAEN